MCVAERAASLRDCRSRVLQRCDTLASLYLTALVVVFWLLVGYALLFSRNQRFAIVMALAWICVYGVGRLFPQFFAMSAVLRALLAVVLALRLKISGAL